MLILAVVKKIQYSAWIGDLLFYCFYFISYPFDVMGYHISILNCIVLTELFYLAMDKIGMIFGKTEVENE